MQEQRRVLGQHANPSRLPEVEPPALLVHTTATGSFFPDDLDDELDDPCVESLCCVPTIEATVEGGPEGMDMVSGMAECTGVAVEGAVVQGTAEGMVEITAVVVEP